MEDWGQTGKEQSAVAVLLTSKGVMGEVVARRESCCMGRQALRPGSPTRPRREIEHWSSVNCAWVEDER